jgi:hypothetical protein
LSSALVLPCHVCLHAAVSFSESADLKAFEGSNVYRLDLLRLPRKCNLVMALTSACTSRQTGEELAFFQLLLASPQEFSSFSLLVDAPGISRSVMNVDARRLFVFLHANTFRLDCVLSPSGALAVYMITTDQEVSGPHKQRRWRGKFRNGSPLRRLHRALSQQERRSSQGQRPGFALPAAARKLGAGAPSVRSLQQHLLGGPW